MTRLCIEGEDLVANIEGFGARLMALGPRIRIRCSAVKSVRIGAPELSRGERWRRALGASFTNRRVGYYWRKGDGISFIDVHHLQSPERIVVIDLEGAHLRHLYVEPSDGSAEQVAQRIQRELQR